MKKNYLRTAIDTIILIAHVIEVDAYDEPSELHILD